MREIEVGVAKAQLEEAEDRRQKSVNHLRAQQRNQTHASSRPEQAPLDLQIQTSKIMVLERQMATAEGLLTRMRKAGSYTQQELDQQQLLRDQAEQELKRRGAALDKIREADDSALRCRGPARRDRRRPAAAQANCRWPRSRRAWSYPASGCGRR